MNTVVAPSLTDTKLSTSHTHTHGGMNFLLSQHKCIDTLTKLTDLAFLTLTHWSRKFTTVHTVTFSHIACLCILCLFVDVAVPIVQENLFILYFARCKISQDKVVSVYDLSPPSNAKCLSLCHFVAFSLQYAASNIVIFQESCVLAAEPATPTNNVTIQNLRVPAAKPATPESRPAAQVVVTHP